MLLLYAMNTKTISDRIPTIEKELLQTIHFPKGEVLSDTGMIEHRNCEAQRAMKLGNYFKDKVKIVFEDVEGIKIVETTVWGVTEGYLMLKRGMMIPLHR